MSRWWSISTTRRRGVLALLCALLGVGGCVAGSDNQPTVRALDTLCGDAASCYATGAVRRTSGPTADSIGYQLGPGAGALTIPFEAGTSSAGVLVRGSGRLYVRLSGCNQCRDFSRRVGADPQWIDLAAGVPDAGIYDAGDAPASAELAVHDDGSQIDIIDVQDTPPSCSVAPAGPR